MVTEALCCLPCVCNELIYCLLLRLQLHTHAVCLVLQQEGEQRSSAPQTNRSIHRQNLQPSSPTAHLLADQVQINLLLLVLHWTADSTSAICCSSMAVGLWLLSRAAALSFTTIAWLAAICCRATHCCVLYESCEAHRHNQTQCSRIPWLCCQAELLLPSSVPTMYASACLTWYAFLRLSASRASSSSPLLTASSARFNQSS